jgi:hypothetical protein
MSWTNAEAGAQLWEEADLAATHTKKNLPKQVFFCQQLDQPA